MKLTKILLPVLMAALLLCGCVFLQENNSTAQLVYVYGDTEIREALTISEATAFINLVSEKSLFDDEITGIFSEDVAICFEGTTFAVAQDGSGMMKVMENGKCFQLSEEENATLIGIFEAHGAKIPCE